jgi:phosphate transport system permease protein
MSPAVLILLALGLGLAGWLTARSRAWAFQHRDGHKLHSVPSYHGWYVALWAAVPALVFAIAWAAVEPQLVTQRVLSDPAAAALPAFGIDRDAIVGEAAAAARGNAFGVFRPEAAALVAPFREAMRFYESIGLAVTLLLGFAGGAFGFVRLRPDFTARTRVERAVMALLLVASLVAVLTTFGIVASLLFETIRFFGMVSPTDFLFGTHWAPDPMSPADQGEKFGAIPLFWGTIVIGAIIAMLVAIPLGLMSANLPHPVRERAGPRWMKPLLEILAGVPTVVYGYFAALTVAPAVRDFGQAIGIASASSESALAAGLVMGVMIIPFVSSMADDSIAAVPQAMRDGSLAMGATTSETIRRVLIPAALPGIVAGVMLAVSRAIGETMIVVMAAGAAARLTGQPVREHDRRSPTRSWRCSPAKAASTIRDAQRLCARDGAVRRHPDAQLHRLAVVKRYREAYE